MFKALPTKQEIYSNFEECKTFATELNNLIQLVELEKKTVKITNENVGILQDLLDKYAKSYNKQISFLGIEKEFFDENNGTRKLIYQHDGVRITYLSRVTWYLGDCDTFRDFYISIDGKEIIDMCFQ